MLKKIVSTPAEISWKLGQIRHGKWEENDDPTKESALTYTASIKLSQLMSELIDLLAAWCPQSISNFKIVDKSYGEISLQWYGSSIELDIDIEDNGRLNFLLSRPGTTRESWISEEDTTVENLILALKALEMVLGIVT